MPQLCRSKTYIFFEKFRKQKVTPEVAIAMSNDLMGFYDEDDRAEILVCLFALLMQEPRSRGKFLDELMGVKSDADSAG
jgi:hypothetical protein